MKPRWRKPTLWILGAVMLSSAFGRAAFMGGCRVNLSSSMPYGVYRYDDTPPVRGGLAAVCLPEGWSALARERGYIRSGECPDGSQPLLKRVVGLAGDVVLIGPEGIAVNGRLQLHSRLLATDRRGRPLFSRLSEGTIPPGQALLLAPTKGSFDGRYFGLVSLRRLRSMRTVHFQGE